MPLQPAWSNDARLDFDRVGGNSMYANDFLSSFFLNYSMNFGSFLIAYRSLLIDLGDTDARKDE